MAIQLPLGGPGHSSPVRRLENGRPNNDGFPHGNFPFRKAPAQVSASGLNVRGNSW
jgi:hypothetical protein